METLETQTQAKQKAGNQNNHQSNGSPNPPNEGFNFWKAEKKGNATLGVKVDHLKYIQFLRESGFYRYDQEHDYTFIHIKNNIMKEVATKDIQDYILDYVTKLADDHFTDGVDKEMVLNAFYRSPQIYFSKQKLSLLQIKKNLTIVTDHEKRGFFYFKNGYIEVTSHEKLFRNYNTLQAHIWQHQIIDREFKPGTEESNWKKFIENVAGLKKNDAPSKERYLALRTMIGYQIHSFYDCELKAVNYTESKISDHDEGGTGKSLLARSTSFVKSYTEIPGKSFKPENEKRYQEVTLGTQIVHLNDVRKDFDLEGVFNDITDGIRVRKLFREPFTIHAKMIISSNRPLVTEGSSAKRRVLEFELADYYNEQRTPETEFKERFFSNVYWDEAKWNAFDNFMINCLQLYLQHGVMSAPELNLSERKLRNQTCQEIIEFLDEKIKSGELMVNQKQSKSDWFSRFTSEYPDYNHLKQKTFTQWLKLYASFKEFKIEEKKSGANLTFCFIKTNQKELDHES